MEGTATSNVDVVVVGAGLAGLSAAVTCLERDIHVLVLEASARIGGRVYTTHERGLALDWGAEWVIPHMHPEVMALLTQAGHTLAENPGTPIANWRTSSGSSNCTFDDLGKSDLAFAKALLQMENDARDFASQPASLHQQEISLRDYLLKIAPASTAEMLEAAIFPLTGADAHEVSTHMLWQEILCHGYSAAETLNADAQRITEGCAILAETLHKKLGKHVQFSTKVTAITIGEEKCEVSTADANYSCRHVICAVPLMTLQDIRFAPALPPELQQTARHSNAGRVAKAWGYCKSASPLHEVFDSQSKLRYAYARRVDTNHWFICGQILAEESEPPAMDTVHALMKECWPGVNIISLDLVSWPHEELARASWHSSRTGWAAHVNSFNADFGRLRFAGGDIAPAWAGWMEGALASGRAAAQSLP